LLFFRTVSPEREGGWLDRADSEELEVQLADLLPIFASVTLPACLSVSQSLCLLGVSVLYSISVVGFSVFRHACLSPNALSFFFLTLQKETASNFIPLLL